MVGLWMMMVARHLGSTIDQRAEQKSILLLRGFDFPAISSIPKYPKHPKAILDSSPQLYFGDRRKTPRVCRTPRPPAIPRLQSSRLGVVEKLTMFGIWTSLKLELVFLMLPSGKLSQNYGISPLSMGKITISMGIFHSYVKLPEGTHAGSLGTSF